jgi:hypothetical protein
LAVELVVKERNNLLLSLNKKAMLIVLKLRKTIGSSRPTKQKSLSTGTKKGGVSGKQKHQLHLTTLAFFLFTMTTTAAAVAVMETVLSSGK